MLASESLISAVFKVLLLDTLIIASLACAWVIYQVVVHEIKLLKLNSQVQDLLDDTEEKKYENE